MTTTEHTFDMHSDVIDVSDITDRVDELEAEQPIESYDDLAELDALKLILDDLRNNGGDHKWDGSWYPGSLIAESYFEEYMDDMLEDCGDLPKNLPCYLKITVDYDALRMDYTEIDIDGTTYLYR